MSEDSAPSREPAPARKPLAALVPHLSAEDHGTAVAMLIRVAGQTDGARKHLEELVAFVEARVPAEVQVYPEEPGLAVWDDEPELEFDDFTARRFGAAVWACNHRLPVRCSELPDAIQRMGHVDESGSTFAFERADTLHELAEVLLRYAESVLGLGRVRELEWHVLAAPVGEAKRVALAWDLLQAARDPGTELWQRETALVACAGLALLARDAGHGQRDPAAWKPVASACDEPRWGGLLRAVASSIFQPTGIEGSIVGLVVAASHRSGRVTHDMLDMLLHDVLVRLGCPPEWSADLDPLTRALRWSATALLASCSDSMRGAMFTFMHHLMGQMSASRTYERGRNHRLAGEVVRLASHTDCPADARDRACAFVAVLAQMDLRARRVSKAEEKLGEMADGRDESPYSWLGKCTKLEGLAAPVLTVARQVLDAEIPDDALAPALKMALETPPPPAPSTQAAPPSPKALKAPRPERWAVYDAMKSGKYTARSLADAIGAERGESMSKGTVTKWCRAVKNYLEQGGTRPADLPNFTSAKGLRILTPESLGLRTPTAHVRPKEDAQAEEQDDEGNEEGAVSG